MEEDGLKNRLVKQLYVTALSLLSLSAPIWQTGRHTLTQKQQGALGRTADAAPSAG